MNEYVVFTLKFLIIWTIAMFQCILIHDISTYSRSKSYVHRCLSPLLNSGFPRCAFSCFAAFFSLDYCIVLMDMYYSLLSFKTYKWHLLCYLVTFCLACKWWFNFRVEVFDASRDFNSDWMPFRHLQFNSTLLVVYMPVYFDFISLTFMSSKIWWSFVWLSLRNHRDAAITWVYSST